MSPNTVAPSTAAPPVNKRSRVILASLIGTSIEFYDFYVYATAAVLVFPTLFFANDDPAVARLASFAVFGVAFIARPIGSIIFGHFGDRIGRKGTLVASLLTMGIATVLIGCIPAGTTPGWAVAGPPASSCCASARASASAASGAAPRCSRPRTPPAKRRAIYGTFPQLGAPIGFIIANCVFLVLNAHLTEEQFLSWGWRVPFLASACS